MRISLLSSTMKPFSTIVRATRECYRSDASSLESDKALFLHILKNEESPLEHASWTFHIDGISRVCSHQLVRHRIASYSQQSQRYVRQEEAYVVPQGLPKDFIPVYESHMKDSATLYQTMLDAGVKRETARYCLPGAWKTSIVMTINLRSFCNLIRLRCSKKAQHEIQDLAKMMLTVVTSSMPTEVITDFLDIMQSKSDVTFI